MKRTIVLLLSTALTVLGRSHPPRPASLPPLLDATLEELSRGLEDGSFTSVDLVRAYTARIREVDDALHAVTEVSPDAVAAAAGLDAARRAGRVRGPLHGVPVLLKNNIATAGDGLNTTAGSFALLGARPPADSTVAARLRRAGAVVLGKTNLSQWSGARSSARDSSGGGWSAHGGQTRGAYAPDQMPCGSSAGSGVAASVGLAWAALGTETAGSIQCPACYNNVVGIKPTVGLTSRHLVVPNSEHQDTVGPLARTVRDAAHLLAAIVGEDANDNYTSAIPFAEGEFPDYVAACQLSGLEGKRIGIPRELFDFRDMVGDDADGAVDTLLGAFNRSLDIMRSAGAVVVDDVALPGWARFRQGTYMRDTTRADLVAGLARYFSQLASNPHNLTGLRDVRRFTHAYGPEAWPDRDTAVWDAALALDMDTTSPRYWANRTAGLRLSGELGILGALRNRSLDALVAPAHVALAPPAMVGAPAVTVPMGAWPPGTPVRWTARGDLVRVGPNVPFGLSFLGDLFSEATLVGMAYAFEQRTDVRRAVRPHVRPRTELRHVVSSSAAPGQEEEEEVVEEEL